jgi:hypothetical protein
MFSRRANRISRGFNEVLEIFSAAVSVAGDVEGGRKPDRAAMRRLGIRADAFDRPRS